MFEAKVTITLKKGVSDPEGANTLKALNLLGFNNNWFIEKNLGSFNTS